LLPLTTTAIPAVDNHHQFFCIVDHNNHQFHWMSFLIEGGNGGHRRLQAAVDGCGSNGIFAAANNDNNWRRTVGSIPPPPSSMTTIINKDRHCRCRYRPPLQPTMTAIAVVNDGDWSRRLHPTIASIGDDRC
jgi:hypothetical protein